MTELQEQFKALEKRYVMKSEAHSKKFSSGVQNEGAYQASAAELRVLYKELQELSEVLNKPIPQIIW